MHLTALSATSLLSFEELHLDLPVHLSVVVGPNGSGKTNLPRVARLMLQGVHAASTADFSGLDREWSLSGWYGSATFEARIGVVFDRDDERSLIEDWGRAAVVTHLRGNTPSLAQRFDGFDPVLSPDLGGGELFATGELIIRRDPSSNPDWSVTWQTTTASAHMDLGRRRTLVPGPLVPGAETTSVASILTEIARLSDPPLAAVEDGSTQELIDEYVTRIGALKLSDLLGFSAPVELIARRDNGWGPEMPAAVRLMHHFPDLGSPGREAVTFAAVLDYLLSTSLTITENRRSPTRRTVGLGELAATPRVGIEDGSLISVELLRLKNGDAQERIRFRTVQDVFAQVTGRRLEVRQQFIEVGAERQEVLIVPVVVDVHPTTGADVDIPLHLSGAGVEEAALLAVLVTDDRRTVILDEPATNMSAVVQRRLLAVVRDRRRGGQTIMITHSVHLVPVRDASDLGLVLRLDRHAGRTSVHRPRLDARSFDQLRELVDQSQLRELLFAAGVVLVEGVTDVDGLGIWLGQAEDYGLPTPESAHVVIVNVGGDERFPKFARLMDTLGVPYAIVADGPAFRAGGALSRLDNPAPEPSDPQSETFEQARKRWEIRRVHTLATQFGIGEDKGKGEIEAFFASMDSARWAQLNAGAGPKDKPQLGRRFASSVPVPEPVIDLWRALLGDLGLT
jgi:OLD-like protein